MIRITDLCKSFSDQPVLRNINLMVSTGEIHGIIGSSGAGKSTLLRCINGLEPYQCGNLIVANTAVSELQGSRLHAFRRKIGMVFQDFALLENKTAYDNISLPLKCWGYAASEIHTRTNELLALVGLTDKLNTLPRELSGGQKQRVAIARSLALNPSIILCDEATSALDPATAKTILKLLKEINEQTNITIVMVTHQLEVVKEICQRLSIMEDKTISLTDTVENVLLNEPMPFKRLVGVPKLNTPPNQVCIKLVLSNEQANNLIFAKLTQALDLNFNIVHTRTESYRQTQYFIFYLSFASQELTRVMQFLQAQPILSVGQVLETNARSSHVF